MRARAAAQCAVGEQISDLCQPSVLYVHGTHTPDHPSSAEEAWHWLKRILRIWVIDCLGLEGCSQPRDLWFIDIPML